MTAAIRTNATTYDCPDEDPGCPYTQWVLCAFNVSKVAEEKVKFMSCWDDTCPGDEPFCPPGSTACDCDTNAGGIRSAAKRCSEAAKIDFAAVSTCQGTGAAHLLHDAALAFEQKWPTHAHEGERFQVPHVLIGGDDMGSNTTIPDLMEALCAKGVQATCTKANLAPKVALALI